MLRKRDKDQNKIRFVDICSPEYSADDNAGISYEQVCFLSVCWCLEDHTVSVGCCHLAHGSAKL